MRALLPTVLAGAFLGVAMTAALLYSFAAAGPNCPGKDPSWLGWCSEAPAYGGGQ